MQTKQGSKSIHKSKPYHPANAREVLLVKAFAELKDQKDIANFLRDLMTPAEIEEFSNRLEIARLLMTTKKSYLDIAGVVGVSTTTVTRVAQWLFKGCGGYQTVLKKLLKI